MGLFRACFQPAIARQNKKQSIKEQPTPQHTTLQPRQCLPPPAPLSTNGLGVQGCFSAEDPCPLDTAASNQGISRDVPLSGTDDCQEARSREAGPLRDALILESSPAVITVFTSDGAVLHQNGQSHRYLGNRTAGATSGEDVLSAIFSLDIAKEARMREELSRPGGRGLWKAVVRVPPSLNCGDSDRGEEALTMSDDESGHLLRPEDVGDMRRTGSVARRRSPSPSPPRNNGWAVLDSAASAAAATAQRRPLSAGRIVLAVPDSGGGSPVAKQQGKEVDAMPRQRAATAQGFRSAVRTAPLRRARRANSFHQLPAAALSAGTAFDPRSGLHGADVPRVDGVLMGRSGSDATSRRSDAFHQDPLATSTFATFADCMHRSTPSVSAASAPSLRRPAPAPVVPTSRAGSRAASAVFPLAAAPSFSCSSAISSSASADAQAMAAALRPLSAANSRRQHLCSAPSVPSHTRSRALAFALSLGTSPLAAPTASQLPSAACYESLGGTGSWTGLVSPNEGASKSAGSGSGAPPHHVSPLLPPRRLSRFGNSSFNVPACRPRNSGEERFPAAGHTRRAASSRQVHLLTAPGALVHGHGQPGELWSDMLHPEHSCGTERVASAGAAAMQPASASRAAAPRLDAQHAPRGPPGGPLPNGRSDAATAAAAAVLSTGSIYETWATSETTAQHQDTDAAASQRPNNDPEAKEAATGVPSLSWLRAARASSGRLRSLAQMLGSHTGASSKGQCAADAAASAKEAAAEAGVVAAQDSCGEAAAVCESQKAPLLPSPFLTHTWAAEALVSPPAASTARHEPSSQQPTGYNQQSQEQQGQQPAVAGAAAAPRFLASPASRSLAPPSLSPWVEPDSCAGPSTDGCQSFRAASFTAASIAPPGKELGMRGMGVIREASLRAELTQQAVRAGQGAAEAECWHEVWAKTAQDPVTGQEVIILTQMDVTAKVIAERHLALVMESEHRLVEQLFPRHILQHITEEWTAGTAGPLAPSAAAGGSGGGEGSGASAPGRGGSSSARWQPVLRDCTALATCHPEVTLLFADIKGFTPMCKELEPRQVMSLLNALYSRYDAMLDTYGVYKVETIGDCYFVAGGLIREDEDGMAAVRRAGGGEDPLQVERVFMFAKAMLAAAREVAMPTNGQPVEIRIGIHTGPVVSGVVGTRMPRFCLFGDTVNTASRMESSGVPGAIHVSEATYARLPRSDQWEPTGGIVVKGKGLMQTYLWRPSDELTSLSAMWATAAHASAAAHGAADELECDGSAHACVPPRPPPYPACSLPDSVPGHFRTSACAKTSAALATAASNTSASCDDSQCVRDCVDLSMEGFLVACREEHTGGGAGFLPTPLSFDRRASSSRAASASAC